MKFHIIYKPLFRSVFKDDLVKSIMIKDSYISVGPFFILCSATCRARPLSCTGSHLDGVKVLQSYEDAKEIHQSCVGHKAVISGASFIGWVLDLLIKNVYWITNYHQFEYYSLLQSLNNLIMFCCCCSVSSQVWRWQLTCLTKLPVLPWLATQHTLFRGPWARRLGKWQCRSRIDV